MNLSIFYDEFLFLFSFRNNRIFVEVELYWPLALAAGLCNWALNNEIHHEYEEN